MGNRKDYIGWHTELDGAHAITSDVEVIKIEDTYGVFERMFKSDVKCRFVIDLASLKAVNK
jgi:uncharacterized zinc-type alcohol dehydrogenase-like protein